MKIKIKKKRERKEKENPTELQKPKVEEEVYNNKKRDWGRIKQTKKLKSIIGFLSANKIDKYNGGGGGEGKEKMQKNLQNKSKIRIVNALLESLLSESFPRWESQSTSPP